MCFVIMTVVPLDVKRAVSRFTLPALGCLASGFPEEKQPRCLGTGSKNLAGRALVFYDEAVLYVLLSKWPGEMF